MSSLFLHLEMLQKQPVEWFMFEDYERVLQKPVTRLAACSS